MITKIQKWGNSLGLRLPNAYIKELKLKENSAVEIKVENKQIVISPVETEEYELKELLSRISESNIHKEMQIDIP
ncbi:MAG: AbrB/MazE/SpoVT family DNA-binding domain-containing protein [Actinobacteria bacterium]|nr:AbrB/MazE/SpoVT family DNA-binding domain-containing protein [Cyanobacteriota bacterium]MCL5770797.1 AbrB/MazE/SpoVT family DNA-binding domain-containing protein [Actinomycetota bacterium]